MMISGVYRVGHIFLDSPDMFDQGLSQRRFCPEAFSIFGYFSKPSEYRSSYSVSLQWPRHRLPTPPALAIAGWE